MSDMRVFIFVITSREMIRLLFILLALFPGFIAMAQTEKIFVNYDVGYKLLDRYIKKSERLYAISIKKFNLQMRSVKANNRIDNEIKRDSLVYMYIYTEAMNQKMIDSTEFHKRVKLTENYLKSKRMFLRWAAEIKGGSLVQNRWFAKAQNVINYDAKLSHNANAFIKKAFKQAQFKNYLNSKLREILVGVNAQESNTGYQTIEFLENDIKRKTEKFKTITDLSGQMSTQSDNPLNIDRPLDFKGKIDSINNFDITKKLTMPNKDLVKLNGKIKKFKSTLIPHNPFKGLPLRAKLSGNPIFGSAYNRARALETNFGYRFLFKLSNVIEFNADLNSGAICNFTERVSIKLTPLFITVGSSLFITKSIGINLGFEKSLSDSGLNPNKLTPVFSLVFKPPFQPHSNKRINLGFNLNNELKGFDVRDVLNGSNSLFFRYTF